MARYFEGSVAMACRKRRCTSCRSATSSGRGSGSGMIAHREGSSSSVLPCKAETRARQLRRARRNASRQRCWATRNSQALRGASVRKVGRERENWRNNRLQEVARRVSVAQKVAKKAKQGEIYRCTSST